MTTITRSCRVCGCTDDRACPGGCSWVEEDLCSACVELIAEGAAEDLRHAALDAGEAILADMAAQEAGPDGDCPAAAFAAPHRVLWRDQHIAYCVSCRTEFTA